jgi:hypothetical protein
MTIRTITLATSSPIEGFPWTVNFQSDDSTEIKTITGFNINITNPFSSPSLFFVNSVAGYDSSHPYVTWRSTSSGLQYNQYPTTGYSLDIWDSVFYNNIFTSNMNWNQIITGNGSGGATYTLLEDKYSLVYYYDTPNAPIYSRGGILTVSVTP